MNAFQHPYSVIVSLKTSSQSLKLVVGVLPLLCTMSFLLTNCRRLQGYGVEA